MTPDEQHLVLARLAQEAERGRDAHVVHLFHLLEPEMLLRPDLLAVVVGRAVPAAQRLGDTQSLLQIHHMAGYALKEIGEWDAADAHLVQALGLARQLDDDSAQARALALRGQIARSRGDHTAGRQLLTDALHAYRWAENLKGQAQSLGDLGNLEHEAGDVDTAIQHYRSALQLFAELGLWSSVAHVHRDCSIALIDRDPPAAVAHGLLAVAAYRREGDPFAAEGAFWELAERAVEDLTALPPRVAIFDHLAEQALGADARALYEELHLRVAVVFLSGYEPEVWERQADVLGNPAVETLLERSADLVAGEDALTEARLRTLIAVLRRARVVGPRRAAQEEADLREGLTAAEALDDAGLTDFVASGLVGAVTVAEIEHTCTRVGHRPLVRVILQALAGGIAMSDWQSTPAPSATLEQAIRRLEASVQQLGPERAGWWWLDAMRNLGSAYRNRIAGDRRENHERAIACLERAVGSGLPLNEGTLPGLVSCRLNLANALLFRITDDPTSDVDRAIDLIEAALPRLPADPPLRGTAYQNLALAYAMRQSGDPIANQSQAHQLYYAALSHLREDHHPAEMALIHANLGLLYRQRLLGDEAANQEASLRHYEKAAALYERIGLRLEAAYAREARASVLARRFVGSPLANLAEAIAETEIAITSLQDLASDYDVAGALNNLGTVYLERARFFDDDASQFLNLADRMLTRALALRPRDRLPREWAQTMHNLGSVQAAKAEQNTPEARQEAVRFYREALTVRTSSTVTAEWAETSVDLGLGLMMRGDASAVSEARQLFTAVVTEPSPPQYAIAAAAALGDIAAREEDWPRAADYYGQAAELHEQRYASALLPGSQLRQASDMQEVFLSLARALARSGNAVGCALALERTRTRLLNESLERDRLDLTRLAAMDPRLHERYVWAATRVRQFSNLEPADLRPDSMAEPNLGPPARWADAEDARAELRSVQDAIAALPAFANFLRPVDAPALERVIVESGPIVYLALMDEGIWALCCSRSEQGLQADVMRGADGGTERVLRRLISPAITTTIEDHRTSFLLAHQGVVPWDDVDLEVLTRELGTDLPPQVWNWIDAMGSQRVTLIPLGILTLAPWHAALLPDGSGRRLIDLCAIAYAPSARALATLTRPQHDDPSAAFFGDPSGDLPAARLEAIELGEQISGSAVSVGTKATSHALLSAFSAVDLLHFAGHGHYDPAAPLQSGLLASDGLVTLAQIAAQTGATAALVVLSACQTGVTDVLSVPDEAIGLPSALLLAGTNGVVASLWPVPDDPTRQLMNLFYEGVASGTDPAVALRDAQLHLSIESYTVRDWAGFTYIGS